MGADSKIAWTDMTFNPWWGCVRVSPGCENCYAEAFDHRLGKDSWGVSAPRQPQSNKYWEMPEKWNDQARRKGIRYRVFCGSMCDWAEDESILRPGAAHVITKGRARLFPLIERTPYLTWLMLSKRIERVAGIMPQTWYADPLPNVWMGTTAEDQAYAERRIMYLRNIPAVRRFVSFEPLLGPVLMGDDWANIHWAIVGGESGTHARPMMDLWAYSLRDQCIKNGVAFFMKQMGGTQDKKDKLEDLPNDLRIREFPSDNPRVPNHGQFYMRAV